MRILVAVLTRERPVALTALVYALDQLAAEPDRVTYAVRPDDDDHETLRACAELARVGIRILYEPGPRYPGLGRIINEGLTLVRDWDVVFLASDGIVPLAPDWDQVVEEHFATGAAAAGWTELCDPTNATYPMITRRWYDAVDGKVCQEFYPFWFADTVVQEVYEFAFGKKLPTLPRLPVASRHDVTAGMRDLAYWFRVFQATRLMRVEQAHRLAKAYGAVPPPVDQILAVRQRIDAWQMERIPQFEKWFKADQGAPSARYLAAKEYAEKLLRGDAPEVVG